ncbi:isoleucine--tRNA ligase [Geoglobus acetivorans]|uniref:Isoleucine--tRNA ligase n=1 Tax=Geoglobus acetivorans TaxID=565033 RepID=A0A0A7GDY8_GEOAI|nr:Isoleucyl-tRNA synthetase [Geoglobus acetivorans]
MTLFTNVYSFRDVENWVNNFWNENKIYQKAKERGKKPFFFVDGPPYTTGRIHLGTAWNKVIKDTVLRFRRMQRYRVTDRPGWDMHGLPIEVKVEQELGIREKKEIERYGIEKFVEKCMKYAIENRDAMTEQFKRLGVWMDWENPYMTIKAEYINSAWWTVKKAHEKGLLERKLMVVNWCPRCETALADAEVEYWEETDPSIYVKFPIRGEDSTFIVIWTTTPWTLPANMAVAVHPSLEYALIKAYREGRIEYLIMAKELAEDILRKGGYELWEIIETKLGEDLVGLEYEHPLADEVPVQKEKKHQVFMADFVSAENTGCVHVAPGHGLEDYELGMKQGLEVFNPVDDRGVYREEAGKYAGLNVKEANKVIIEDLRNKGLLLAEEKITHRYGHCWRCKTPIIYRATEQWFLKVSEVRDRMLEEVDGVRWIPDWAGMARFRDWVSNARDWCISRQRYWGIPIPVWICEKCGKEKVVGDINEIDWKEDLDLHRPRIDAVTFECECGGTMRRVEDVFDVWFDSGVASWGTLSYPFEREMFEKLWPADFITEGHDQTRGWFYSQLGTSVIAFGKAPYKTVLMHGFTLDEKGRKMSKSLGNVVEPEKVVEKIGVDGFRLYVLSSALWEDLKFSWNEAENYLRVLNIFWNAVRFAHTYMELDDFREVDVESTELRVEDRWILSRLERFVKTARDALENYQLHRLVKEFSRFVVEDFSRWYVQLVRRRVWEEKDSPAKISAYATMFRVVKRTTLAVSPVAPFISEYIYQNFVRKFGKGEESVFFEEYPHADESWINDELDEMMAIVRDVSEASYNARQKAGIKLRWPLRKLVVEGDESVRKAVEALREIILNQCNVKEVEHVEEFEKIVVAKPNFRKLGPVLKDRVGDFAKYVSSLSQDELREIVKNGEIQFDGTLLKVSEALEVSYKSQEGYEVAEFGRGTVYLYTVIDEELKREAFAREVVRRIQEMRKEMDLEVDEFIRTYIDLSPDELEGWVGYVKEETRSREMVFGRAEGYVREWDIDGRTIKIGIERYEA